jgi:O-antigen biosynthesis protein WbqV
MTDIRGMPGITNSRNMRLLAFAYDVAMAPLAMYLALILRLGDFEDIGKRNVVLGALVPFALAVGVSLLVMRTYRTSWRHASTADLTNIVYAVSLAVLFYFPLSFVVTRLSHIPRSSVVMAWMILILLMAGSRVGYRLYREGALVFSRRPMSPNQVPILIVGGGTDAEILLRSLDRGSEYYPVGVLDDAAQGAMLRGVPVRGRVADAEKVIEDFQDAGDRPRKLVVVDRTLPASTLEELVKVANRQGLTVARGPDPSRLMPGASDAPELQAISVEDLLGRAQIVLDLEPVRRLVAGKRVLVTGAGGSIGSEIVRQVAAIGPAALCLIDSSEFNLYTIDAEAAALLPETERMVRIVDVRHRIGVRACFATFRPDIVFHAAALKHVPLVEENPLQGVWTNVVGSHHVCDAAQEAKCQAMVLISTDKAVNPANVMGATKRCAEIYCQSLALSHADHGDATRFVIVRFGNVLGSTGSVVPLFERQLKAGGPITVTHPDIERYFMTIREAVQLVLQASALGAENKDMVGRVFVLDMGSPVRIADLARQMIRLAGLTPETDIAIRYTGLRPGEKLSEELFHDSDQVEATPLPRVNVATEGSMPLARLKESISRIEQACIDGAEAAALQAMWEVINVAQGERMSTPEPAGRFGGLSRKKEDSASNLNPAGARPVEEV